MSKEEGKPTWVLKHVEVCHGVAEMAEGVSGDVLNPRMVARTAGSDRSLLVQVGMVSLSSRARSQIKTVALDGTAIGRGGLVGVCLPEPGHAVPHDRGGPMAHSHRFQGCFRLTRQPSSRLRQAPTNPVDYFSRGFHQPAHLPPDLSRDPSARL